LAPPFCFGDFNILIAIFLLKAIFIFLDILIFPPCQLETVADQGFKSCPLLEKT
jgi:hypothetical protein